MRRTLYIRVDVNKEIATGHAVRCMSIAQAAEASGYTCVFVVADRESAEFIKKYGYECHVLESNWRDMESELPKLISYLQSEGATHLLIDSYYATENGIAELNKQVNVVYMDDFGQKLYPAEMLIHYPVYAAKEDYAMRYRNRKILCGCNYAPLKKAFADMERKRIQDHVQRILVMTGGSDHYHVSRYILKHLLQEPLYAELTVDMICGGYNEDYEELVGLCAERGNIRVHQRVDNIEKYMNQADIAISAGGTTLYELCACGTPTICYIMAENQVQNVMAFCEKGFMRYGGDARSGEYWDEIKEQLDSLMDSCELRRKMSESMQNLVDGKGAIRIAREIMAL